MENAQQHLDNGPSQVILRADAVSFSYSGAVAVSDISFDVLRGEALALLGSNGAGKSTTVKLIAGVLRCRKGSIMFEGEDITRLSSHEIVERGITLVPEGRLVFPRLNVMDHLEMGAYPSRARQARRENIERVLALFPRLAERRSQLAGSMSGGEQQMLAIARGLMSNPSLVILDEPSLGLMPSMVDYLFDLIDIIRKSGTSLILVEQNAYRTLEIADRACVLEKGVVTLRGTGRDLLTSDYVRQAFLGL